MVCEAITVRLRVFCEAITVHPRMFCEAIAVYLRLPCESIPVYQRMVCEVTRSIFEWFPKQLRSICDYYAKQLRLQQWIACLPSITMAKAGNIVIADESALHLLLHSDLATHIDSADALDNPLDQLALTPQGMMSFNLDNRLYGEHPVKLLVNDAAQRRKSRAIECRYSKLEFPPGSFLRLRDGLYVTSPELTYARMADRCSESRLAEIATALSGRYYLADKVRDRSGYLTSVSQLRAYLAQLPSLRGGAKARHALDFAMDNSGSPMEGKSMLQFCMPKRWGGFSLPFDCMNFDIRTGKTRAFYEQNEFCVDLASRSLKVAIEFDGGVHLDPSKDKRRRNALMALGWTVFPLEKDVLYSPAKTEQFALQVAKFIGLRIQRQKSWDEAYVDLRRQLDLPV